MPHDFHDHGSETVTCGRPVDAEAERRATEDIRMATAARSRGSTVARSGR